MDNLENELIDDLIQAERELREAFSEPLEAREAKALQMEAEGLQPCCSTGLGGELTCGYGLLDDNGYWQYSLRVMEEDR